MRLRVTRLRIAALAALLAALSLASPARATEQSSYVMPSAGPMAMASFVTTYLNPGLRALSSCHNGASAPLNGPSSLPLLGQCWLDTTANPNVLKIYDGASWITFANFNTSTHAYANPNANLAAIGALSTAADKVTYWTGSGTAALLDFPSWARSVVSAANAGAGRTAFGLAIGTDVQAFDADLAALAANSTDGLWAHTGAGTGSARTLTAPAAGFTITNPAGIAGNPTFVLANDLAALEGLSGTGIARRTGTDAWSLGTTVALNEGGTGQITAAAGRASSGLNVESFTGHGDSIYTILATDKAVGTNAAFTASRTWTLPAANAVNPGQPLVVADFQGTVTGTNTLVIARAGSDAINGGTSVTISNANGAYVLWSDGVSKWTAQAVGPAAGGGSVTSVICNGGATTITTTGTCASREVLSSSRTYYVRTDGNNNCNGTTNAAGASGNCAWATLVFALAFIRDNLDIAGFIVTVSLPQVGSTVFTMPAGTDTCTGAFTGATTPANVVVQGNASWATPASATVLNGTTNSSFAFRASYGCQVTISNLVLRSNFVALSADFSGTRIFFQNILWQGSNTGAAAAYDTLSYRLGYTEQIGADIIQYGSASSTNHIGAVHQGEFRNSAQTTTFGNNAAYGTGSNGYASAQFAGQVVYTLSPTINLNGMTVTGQRCYADSNAIVEQAGLGATFFPGNAACSSTTGGQVIQ